jgi:hypothetical protein
MNRIDASFLIVLLMASSGFAQKVTYYDTGEEFAGPFPSWRNVKTDYGAIGDGKANDTQAIQRALDDMKTVRENEWCVLYFPAGRYRIDDTLVTERKAHHDYLGSNLVGEDPETTVLVWDGGEKPMFRYDAWYCKVSRLTFDGGKKAINGLVRAGGFSTYCELSDLWFRDIPGIAVNLGNNEKEGAAEHAILRCRFMRCGGGISTINWNTLDIWVWHCLFEDCGRGIYNLMGGYQAYGNVFLRSKEMDLGSTNGMAFAAVENTSVGSSKFLSGVASEAYVRANHVHETVGPTAVDLRANIVLIDNSFFSSPNAAGPVVQLPNQTALLIGNTYNAAKHPVGPRFSNLQQKAAALIDNKKDEFSDPGCCHSSSAAADEIQPSVIQWNGLFDQPHKVKHYAIYAPTDPKYAPRDFELQAAPYLGAPWTTLDRQQGLLWKPNQKHVFPLKNNQAFAIYRLVVTASASGTPGIRIAEIELLDEKKRDITEDKAGFLMTRHDYLQSYLAMEEKAVVSRKRPEPVLRLPGVPKKAEGRVFEIRRGTGDDAQEIQAQIDLAAQEPTGSKPIVHIPKGTWKLTGSITVPPLCDVQIVGDGCENGTLLSYAGGDEPLLRLKGPSRATLRDFHVVVGYKASVEAIVIDNADQVGGQIVCDQLNAMGTSVKFMTGTAIHVNGVTNTQVMMTNGGLGGCLTGLKVRGNSETNNGRSKRYPVTFLCGATGGACRLVDVQQGGAAVAEAFWYEGDFESPAALLDLSAASSGELSLAAVWWHLKEPSLPMVSLSDFEGQCTIVASSLDHRRGPHVHLKGSGSQTRLFMAGTSLGPESPDTNWLDETTPPAATAMFGTNAENSAGKMAAAVVDRGFIVKSLEQLRSVRIHPSMQVPPEATNVRIVRVLVVGGNGTDAVRFNAGP